MEGKAFPVDGEGLTPNKQFAVEEGREGKKGCAAGVWCIGASKGFGGGGGFVVAFVAVMLERMLLGGAANVCLANGLGDCAFVALLL